MKLKIWWSCRMAQCSMMALSISSPGLWGIVGFPWLTALILHTQGKTKDLKLTSMQKVPVLISASLNRRLLVTLSCSLTERPSCYAFIYDSQIISFHFPYCSCAFIHIIKFFKKFNCDCFIFIKKTVHIRIPHGIHVCESKKASPGTYF